MRSLDGQRAPSRLLFASFLPLLAACGSMREPAVPLAEHFEESSDPTWGRWAQFAAGERVSVVASDGCPEQVASSSASLSGEPLTQASWPHRSASYTILESSFVAGPEGHVALMLRGDASELAVVRIPAGVEPTCVSPVGGGAKASIASFLGKPLRFQPSNSACTHIEAAGASLATVLLSEDPDPIVFASLTIAPEHAGVTTGPKVAWAAARGADLRVRADLLATCFVADDAPASAPDDAPQGKSRLMLSTPAKHAADGPHLLHLDARRCKHSSTPRGEHLECATPVGVWQGQRSAEAVSLQLVRRNVGTLHFVAGKAAEAKAFARTIVAVRTGVSSDASVERLYAGIRTATSAALSSDESIRMAVGDETANLTIPIDVTDVRVSDKATRTESVPHEYQDGTRDEPNPKKAAALRSVQAAETGVETAKEQCTRKKETARANYDTCIAAAKAASDLANGKLERSLLTAGNMSCTVMKAAMDSSCEEISEAQAKLQEARATEASTSATITVPVMKRASYTKTIFSRRVTAQAKMSSTLDGAQQVPVSMVFTKELTDFAVEANPSIKLAAHRAGEPWLEDAKAAVPAIGDSMAAWVSTQVRSVVGKAGLARAKSTLRATGEEVKPGFEALGGMAIEVAGDRLRGAHKMGSVAVAPGSAVVLPRPSGLAPNECLLVVAMLPEGSTGKLDIATADGTIADVRGRPYGSIEVCRSDVSAPAAELPAVQLTSSDASGDVRWGEFRTSAFAGPAGGEGTTENSREAGGPLEGVAGGPAPAAAELSESILDRRPAPLVGLTAYARAGAATWLTGSVGDASIGEVFTPAPSVSLGGGVRVGSGWLAYGEWERGFVGVGTRSPIVNFSEVSSRSDTFLVGARKTFTGWLANVPGVGGAFISPLVDVALGYSVLRQEGTDVAGDSRLLRLPSGALRLMTGVSLRPSRWFSVDPVFGGLFGWVNQIEAEQNVRGEAQAGTGQFESGSLRASLFFGVTGVVDVPFGDGRPRKAAPKQSATNEERR